MKCLFALPLFLICTGQAAAQSTEPADTVAVNMLDHSYSERDSSRIRFDRDVQRFFNRNLRGSIPGREVIKGYASVSFWIDKAGKGVNPACTSMTNKSVGEEALRVAQKLPSTYIEPLYINGKPVVAKVNINICFTTDEEYPASKEVIQSKAGIVVIAYPNR